VALPSVSGGLCLPVFVRATHAEAERKVRGEHSRFAAEIYHPQGWEPK